MYVGLTVVNSLGHWPHSCSGQSRGVQINTVTIRSKMIGGHRSGVFLKRGTTKLYIEKMCN